MTRGTPRPSGMKTGPKEEPLELKARRGDPRALRAIREGAIVRTNGEHPAPEEMHPPSWVKGNARKYWKEVYPILSKMDVLAVGDCIGLTTLVDVFAYYIQCRNEWDKVGNKTVDYTSKGDSKTCVEMESYFKAFDRFLRIITQYGLTPASRSSLRKVGKDLTPITKDGSENGTVKVSDFFSEVG